MRIDPTELYFRQIKSSHWVERLAAVRGFQDYLDRPGVYEALLPLLNDPCAQVRRLATRAVSMKVEQHSRQTSGYMEHVDIGMLYG